MRVCPKCTLRYRCGAVLSNLILSPTGIDNHQIRCEKRNKYQVFSVHRGVPCYVCHPHGTRRIRAKCYILLVSQLWSWPWPQNPPQKNKQSSWYADASRWSETDRSVRNRESNFEEQEIRCKKLSLILPSRIMIVS